MAFNNYRSYLLFVSCIALVLFSGLVTSLGTPAIVLDESCAPGSPDAQCCSGLCSPTCDQDCKGKGFSFGGFCDTLGVDYLCCCFKQ
ncbi:unnamed protein product [Lathyrus oleraceus]|uniref:LCR-like protein n=1 Tax=Pisum sativum TaxID=3888 RepID=A0A9D5AGM9_PEA|nr:hypothetical protein KIW84_056217 [Pisum sativum]